MKFYTYRRSLGGFQPAGQGLQAGPRVDIRFWRQPSCVRTAMGDRKILLDAMVGTLATYLRMCGYDAAYALDRDVESDDRLLEIAAAEDRLIVTRDRSLAKRASSGVLVESRDVSEQLRELEDAGFDLSMAETPAHCGRCNGRLEAVSATESTPEYAPDPAEELLWQCSACGQYFWRGSHWDAVAETLASL